MDNVTEKLLECFGHRKFKSELQERAVRAIARGKFSVLLDNLSQNALKNYTQ